MSNEKCLSTGRREGLAGFVVLRIYGFQGMSRSAELHESSVAGNLCGPSPITDSRLCFAGGLK